MRLFGAVPRNENFPAKGPEKSSRCPANAIIGSAGQIHRRITKLGGEWPAESFEETRRD
jgi:hypothetical protein